MDKSDIKVNIEYDEKEMSATLVFGAHRLKVGNISLERAKVFAVSWAMQFQTRVAQVGYTRTLEEGFSLVR